LLRKLLRLLEDLFNYLRLFEKLLNSSYLIKKLLIVLILKLEILNIDLKFIKKVIFFNLKILSIYSLFIR